MRTRESDPLFAWERPTCAQDMAFRSANVCDIHVTPIALKGTAPIALKGTFTLQIRWSQFQSTTPIVSTGRAL